MVSGWLSMVSNLTEVPKSKIVIHKGKSRKQVYFNLFQVRDGFNVHAIDLSPTSFVSLI